ncbi:LysR family transcriptional regulator [Reyranella sp. CPCC 100927]|uniref:LysR family transcriptional regulator n=1 Tax=Reyranella sp. CPCC 100927 TaxID=2599616 RepID=UPI00351AA2F5
MVFHIMDLRQIRHFLAVAEDLNFSRAAERLRMTQPPLSQSILALETELGVRLFVRTKRSVALTPVGADWLPHARQVLADAAALPGIAQRLSQGELGALRVGFVSTADYSVLPDLVSRYKARYPDVAISLQEMTGDLQIEALLDGDIDVGLIIPPPRPSLHPTLAYRRLVTEPLVVAVSEQWLAAARVVPRQGHLRLADVATEPLVLFPRRSSPSFHDVITGYYANNGIAPRMGQQAIQMQTIMSLVSAGMGVALVPRSLENLGRTGVRCVPLEGTPPSIETGLVWRRDNALPTLEGFVAMARHKKQ